MSTLAVALLLTLGANSPKITTHENSIKLSVPTDSDVVFETGSSSTSVAELVEADAAAAAGVAELAILLADNVTALQEAANTAAANTNTLVQNTKADIMSDVNTLNASLDEVSGTIFGGRSGRSSNDECVTEKCLLDLNADGNALLEKIKEAVEKQLQTKTLPSARISTFKGCDPTCDNGDTTTGYFAIGRDFIPAVEDLYHCKFTTEAAKEFETKGTASSEFSLKCPLPSLTAKQIGTADTVKFELTITEGKALAVPYLGSDDQATFSLKPASPKVGQLDDVTKTLAGREVTVSAQLSIIDPDSERFTFKVVQKGSQVMQNIQISDKGMLVYKLKPAVQGSAVVTITVTDNQKNSVDTVFKVVVYDKIDDRIHVTRCLRIQVYGAGGKGGVANGIYDQVPGFRNGWPQFCKKVNGRPFCYDQTSSARASRLYSYGGKEWGIQTNSGCGMHHRYYQQSGNYASVLTDMKRIRESWGCTGGSNPTPSMRCLKEAHQRRIVDRAPIDSKTCTKIVVVSQDAPSDGKNKYIAGVYGRCPATGKPRGLLNGRPVYGKYIDGGGSTDWNKASEANCEAKAINGEQSIIFWDAGWGWGIQAEGHHRFSECDGGGKTPSGAACNKGEAADFMGQFTNIRGSHASGRVPSSTCVAWE